jgi:hypothetical protein
VVRLAMPLFCRPCGLHARHEPAGAPLVLYLPDR